MQAISQSEASANASVMMQSGLADAVKPKGQWRIECRDKDGNLKWTEDRPNLVTTEGKNYLLTEGFAGSSYTAAWYVGLIDNASFSALAAGDTAAQIGGSNGWSESTAYSNSTRVTWSGGTASAGSISNSGSAAVFNINATATINGAFLVSSSTKGGTSGKIYAEVSFGSTRSVLNGDTLTVTYTLTLS